MKQKSQAYKKVEAVRDHMNKGRTKILSKDLSCTVYLYERRNRYCLVGYVGRATKAAFNYYYTNPEARAQKIKQFMLDNQHQQTQRTKAKANINTLQPDDILMSSWGYEQTNVDYYQVIRRIGKTMVEIIQIDKHKTFTDNMQGKCTPDPTITIGEPMRRRVNHDSVKITYYQLARKITPIHNNDSEKTYRSISWSSYH